MEDCTHGDNRGDRFPVRLLLTKSGREDELGLCLGSRRPLRSGRCRGSGRRRGSRTGSHGSRGGWSCRRRDGHRLSRHDRVLNRHWRRRNRLLWCRCGRGCGNNRWRRCWTDCGGYDRSGRRRHGSSDGWRLGNRRRDRRNRCHRLSNLRGNRLLRRTGDGCRNRDSANG
jgi:hypothetical protein